MILSETKKRINQAISIYLEILGYMFYQILVLYTNPVRSLFEKYYLMF